MRFRLIAASIVLFQALLIQQFVAQRFPLSADDHSYLYQARLFAAGQLYAEDPLYDYRHPLHTCIETNCLRDESGRRFSKYAPGWPAVLALGVLLHVPWLVHPLVAAALTFMLLAHVARTIGTSAEKTAGWLLIACVFWAYYGASYRPHMLTAFCVFAAYLAFERGQAANRRREPNSAHGRTEQTQTEPTQVVPKPAEPATGVAWLLLSAALLGYSALVRYTDWIPLAAWIVYVLWRAGRIRSLVVFGTVFACVAAGNLAWGWVLAGRLFVVPTHLGGSIGDHDRLALSWNGLLFTFGRLAMLCWVFPPVLFLVSAWRKAQSSNRRNLIAATARRTPDDDLSFAGAPASTAVRDTVNVALFGANVAIYALFGAAPGGPGPRYFLPYFPFLVIAVVSVHASLVESRTRRQALWRILVAAQLAGSAIFIARETYTLNGRRDVARTVAEAWTVDGTDAQTKAAPLRAVLLETGTYHTDARDLTMNPPDLDASTTLYFASCGAADVEALRTRFSNRQWLAYRYPGELTAIR